VQERNVALFSQRVDQHFIERLKHPSQWMRAWI
jgi:hypothetical protein